MSASGEVPRAIALAFQAQARAYTFPLDSNGYFSADAAIALDSLACDAFERYGGAVTVRELSGEDIERVTGVRVCGTVDALEYGTACRYAVDLRVDLRVAPIESDPGWGYDRTPRAHVSMGWRKLGRDK